MMSTIENPKITLHELNTMEDRIRNNQAESSDYERLDNYLSFLGNKDFILLKLKASNIINYEDFIYKRKMENSSVINLLVGAIFGAISFLRNHISGKL